MHFLPFCMPTVDDCMHGLHTSSASVWNLRGAFLGCLCFVLRPCGVYSLSLTVLATPIHPWKSMQDATALELETGCKHRSWQEVRESFDGRPSEAAAAGAPAATPLASYPDTMGTSAETKRDQTVRRATFPPESVQPKMLVEPT